MGRSLQGNQSKMSTPLPPSSFLTPEDLTRLLRSPGLGPMNPTLGPKERLVDTGPHSRTHGVGANITTTLLIYPR